MEPGDPRSKPACHQEDAVEVVRTLRNAGQVAYFAGGCVRDLLLNRTPKDFDVATDALPDKVRSLFRNTQAVGQAFGVILIRLGGSVIEVATFRSDGEYLDGRRPSTVKFTTAEEDAKRRDFTINGLFFDPIEQKVLDFVGGKADLENKVLRAIGEPDHRFEEDHLRLMRAVRFAARFGLVIEARTRAAIQHHAPQLARISPERIGEETRQMLTPSTRTIAREHLRELGLLKILLRFLGPSPVSSDGLAVPFFNRVAPSQPIGFGLALAALTLEHRLNPTAFNWPGLFTKANIVQSVQACRKSLKISNEESSAMEGALDVSMLLASQPPSVATLKRFLARLTSRDARLLLNAIGQCDPSFTRVAWLEEQFAVLEKTDCAPLPWVTGDDLTAAGFAPGPMFKRVLDQVYDAQLEGRLHSRFEALDFAVRAADR